jgi:hypothetical protein
MPDPFPKPASLFPAPEQAEVVVEREALDGLDCERCGGSRVERYPILRVGGWKRVTRCRDCLFVLASEDAPTPMGFTYVPFGASLRHQIDVGETAGDVDG